MSPDVSKSPSCFGTSGCRHQRVIHDDVPKHAAGLLTSGEHIL